MSIASKLDQLHYRVRQNRWMGLFAIFNRVMLALGFIPSGMVKILGERFTDLHNHHPLGHYLEALHHTGYYYTFIGVLQVTAAVLLLIPRTALLGAIIYFPIILNICILSMAVRFQGSLLTAPFMILANIYLFCWDYHRLRLIFPFNHGAAQLALPQKENRSWKFPWRFFTGVFATVVIGAFILIHLWAIKPLNTIEDCRRQCPGSDNPAACYTFCDCVHSSGEHMDQCLHEYYKATADNTQVP